MEPVLSIQELTIGYRQKRGDVEVMANINAELPQGCLVSLIAPNGAGKSTLLRTLAALHPPLQGKVTIAGKALDAMTAGALAKKVSVVLTDKVDVGNITVAAMVALGRHPYTGMMGGLSRVDKEKVMWALEATGTLDFALRSMHDLSDGERQKVMIARALAQDTPLILLDEPTAFLDLPNRVEILQLLKTLAATTQKTILLSTHDLDLALQISDTLWVINREKILLTGTPEMLSSNGTIAAVFANEQVHFDVATGTFKLVP